MPSLKEAKNHADKLFYQKYSSYSDHYIGIENNALLILIPEIKGSDTKKIGEIIAIILRKAYDAGLKVASCKYTKLREMDPVSDPYEGWRIRIKKK